MLLSDAREKKRNFLVFIQNFSRTSRAINWKFNRFLICLGAARARKRIQAGGFCYGVRCAVHDDMESFSGGWMRNSHRQCFYRASANWYEALEAKQRFQLIFKFDVFPPIVCTCRRGHTKQGGVASESINLLSKKPKKRIWKVKAAPEFDEEEDEGAIKDVG